MIDYEALSPHPSGSFLLPKYYGGPLDGHIDHSVAACDIKGTIRQAFGCYSLQGFRRNNPHQMATEYAVYEWVFNK